MSVEKCTDISVLTNIEERGIVEPMHVCVHSTRDGGLGDMQCRYKHVQQGYCVSCLDCLHALKVYRGLWQTRRGTYISQVRIQDVFKAGHYL